VPNSQLENVMKILQVNASVRGPASHSSRLADAIVQRLCDADPRATLAVRDLGRQPHPALDAAALEALSTAPSSRTPEQSARIAQDDALIAEVQAADVIVLGVPMYNFGVPSGLKSWIDAVTRARVTFRYTETGSEGLLAGRKVYVALARGGRYRNTPGDHQVAYLRTILAFLGLTDVDFVYAEGLALGAEAERQGLASAYDQIDRLLGAEALAA
jgi:FMN-dependent NADH-azoreductase